MKKIFFVVAFVVAFSIIFFTMAKAEDIIVGGYQVGDYAVKGAVKERLDSIVSQLSGKQVIITVAGSADTAGKSVANTELAAKRAEHACAYLAAKLPLADVKASWSEGDSANARQIKVSFVAQSSGSQKIWSSEFSLGLAILGAISLVLVAIFYVHQRGKKPAVVARKQPFVAKKKVTIPLEKNGLFETEIEWDEATGRWLTPFRHLSGGDQMWGKDEGSARRSAQKCWRDATAYSDQIGKLITQGVIRKKNKKQATA